MKTVLLDLETTGLDFKKDRIIEFGALIIEKVNKEYVVIKEIDEFVNIGIPLTNDIINLTHINDEMLTNKGISEAQLLNILQEIIGYDTLIIAYNIQFDISFLNEFMRRNTSQTFLYQNPLLDVMSLYKDRHEYPHKLSSAILKYGICIPNSHRAIDDIKATLALLNKMILEKENISKYVNVIGYNKKYGVNGVKLPHITYIAQDGGKKEIEKL